MFYLGDPDQGFVSSVPDLELMDRQENAILHKLAFSFSCCQMKQ